jgi:hypothetical protein
MGQGVSLKRVYGNKNSAGRACLGSDRLLFRHDARPPIPTKAFKAAEADAVKPAVRFEIGSMRIAVLFVAYFLAQCAHADVIYECNAQQDYISILETEYAKTESVVGQTEIIPGSDGFHSNLHTNRQDRYANQAGPRPVVRRCHLSSGDYIVQFYPFCTGDHPDGLSCGSDQVMVEIKRDEDTVLTRTVMGRCVIPHSEGVSCKDVWAAMIKLSGRTGHVNLMRFVYL